MAIINANRPYVDVPAGDSLFLMGDGRLCWSDVPLHPRLLSLVHELFNFGYPTQVQLEAIKPFLQHKDVVVEAVTGSGKTLAYLLPVLQTVYFSEKTDNSSGDDDSGGSGIQAIIIAPTRELAAQIDCCLNRFKGHVQNLSSILLIGGTDIEKDVLLLSASLPNIVVATPGRLDDLLSSPSSRSLFSFLKQSLQVLVLDEADRLLDLGFSSVLSRILSHLPKQRRTGLFSATMNDSLDELVRTGLRNPLRVSVSSEHRTPATLSITYIPAFQDDRIGLLLTVLKEKTAKTIVYFATCAAVDYYYLVLRKLYPEIMFLALHGKMVPKRRQGVVKAFAESSDGVLLCTDLAARGLDFAGVELVIQMDAPQDPKSVAHRCGRAARAGNVGSAILFISPGEEAYVELLRRRGVPIEQHRPISDRFGSTTCAELRALNKQDRECYEKSIVAFVSYIRFFCEHYCKYIFVFKELKVERVLAAFGMLHLPKMPELRQFDLSSFKADGSTAPESIPYSDPFREGQRLQRLSTSALKARPKDRSASKRTSAPWCKSKERKEKKATRKKQMAVSKADPELLKRLWRQEEQELENDWREHKQEVKGKK